MLSNALPENKEKLIEQLVYYKLTNYQYLCDDDLFSKVTPPYNANKNKRNIVREYGRTKFFSEVVYWNAPDVTFCIWQGPPLFYVGGKRLFYAYSPEIVNTTHHDHLVPMPEWKVNYCRQHVLQYIHRSLRNNNSQLTNTFVVGLDKRHFSIKIRDFESKSTVGSSEMLRTPMFIEIPDTEDEKFITVIPSGTLLYYKENTPGTFKKSLQERNVQFDGNHRVEMVNLVLVHC